MSQLVKVILKVCENGSEQSKNHSATKNEQEKRRTVNKNSKGEKKVEKAKDIVLMFNPEEISFTRSVKWEPAKASKGKTLLPKVNFSGVEPYKLTLKQLLFDTYESKESVMKAIDNIKKGVELAERTSEKRPPIYLLMWGENEYFHCVITSLTYKLNMFLADGTPVRAMVDISLQEVDKPNQPKTDAKPASRGAARTNSKPPPKASPVPPRKKPK